jgi:hypothetical protein
MNKVIEWFVPKFCILLLGAGLGYAWCAYHDNLAIDRFREEIRQKQEQIDRAKQRIDRLVLALGHAESEKVKIIYVKRK